MFRFAQPDLLPPVGKHKEWLLTNGIGGFAASTISGINTRRYHGLLIASLKPPVDRRLMLAKLEEEIIIDGRKHSLFSSETLGGFSGYGFDYLIEFRKDPLPTYIYQIEDCILEKEIMLVYGQNTALVHYRLINNNERLIRLNIIPLVTSRDYHWTTRRNDWPFKVSPEKKSGGAIIEAYPSAPLLYLSSDKARWEKFGFWHLNLFYEHEAHRGLDAVEDLFCPLCFVIESEKSVEFCINASTEPPEICISTFGQYKERELNRQQSLIEHLPAENQELKVLTWAADSFLVKRVDLQSLTVIAGYPWFTDWGRDTMIALPGLTLTTGRFDDFRRVIRTFLAFEKDGLLPNLFPDNEGSPAYNTADAAMWVFWCLYKYLEYTDDLNFLEEQYPILVRIVENHVKGTQHGIKMTKDGLITQGEPFKALTWMDARVGDEVITPRRGKTVEINALWCFALTFMSFLAGCFGDGRRSCSYKDLGILARNSFQESFWFENGGYLYDLVDDNKRDESIRCNQIIALSLPIRLLTADQERKTLGTVWRHLYAGYGLKTLALFHHQYRGRCIGNQYERDSAYHQGTVWVWPWGHFITALNRIYGSQPGIQQLTYLLASPLIAHLNEECLGTVSEIFDGDPPHRPRGCFAQAWSVAELLRIIYEEIEGLLPNIGLSTQLEGHISR